MKKEKIINDIKSAGVVTAAVLTLNACGNRQLSESQLQTVQHKTDSAEMADYEYKVAMNIICVGGDRVKQFRDVNKNLVKKYSKEYIKQVMPNSYLRKLMLKAIDDETLTVIHNCTVIDSESDTSAGGRMNAVNNIRKNQRWFYDLMLYLSGNYNDRQLLNSEFFKTVNDPRLKSKFENNTEQIEKINSCLDLATQRKNVIHQELWNKYVQEEKRKR